ncbi:MAG: alpha-glucuronidase family glycosyl hydrolase [Lentisphaeria bacterium]|nr:alpha-glucuronidase family glycosyl hydrolase [Lentisphaeria bacterium]
MPSKSLHIQISPDAHALERRAASELRQYVRQLFGFTPNVSETRRKAGRVITLGTGESSPGPGRKTRLGREGYAICCDDGTSLEICGGSPIAVLWAAYELIEQWGVTFLVQGDVMPEPGTLGPFHLPQLNVVRRPVFEQRTFRILNDMLNSGILWSLNDHERLFDQLVKLRFNTVVAATYPHHPWWHWSFRGVERTQVDLVYGFRHVIHKRSVGRDVIGRLGHYTNPDFQGAETYSERLAAGQRLMHGIIAAAHQRGLKFIMGHNFNYFPDEFLPHLARWSKKHRIPKSIMAAERYSTLGLHGDTGNAEFGHLMTPLNPVYVEMIESWLTAVLETYPEIDSVLLSPAEFPPNAGGIEICWKQLSRRHKLAPEFSLDKIGAAAARHKIGGQPGRSVREALGAVATIRLLDLVLNEHQVVQRINPGMKVYASLMSDALLGVIPHIFDPTRFEFLRVGDYTTSSVASSMDRLACARDSAMSFHVTTTINDDNVGFLPQFNFSALHETMRAMRRHGAKGYFFRQFDISEYEPVMAYMAEAGWDHTATPRKTYERQVERICGKDAVKPMLKAFRMLEASLKDANAVIGAGFMMPHLVAKYWRFCSINSSAASISPRTRYLSTTLLMFLISRLKSKDEAVV